MGAPILRNETVEALRECVLIAEELHRFGLAEALRDCGLAREEDLADPFKLRFVFDGILKAVNWSERDSILPIIPIFEDAYAESPKNFHTIHQRIDKELAQDGFRIKRGRLIKLPL